MGVLTKYDQNDPIYLSQSAVKFIYLHPVYTSNYQLISNSAVGTAMGNELDDQGSIRGRGKILHISTASGPPQRLTPPRIQWVKEPLSPGA
jgi:hypothetical protein